MNTPNRPDVGEAPRADSYDGWQQIAADMEKLANYPQSQQPPLSYWAGRVAALARLSPPAPTGDAMRAGYPHLLLHFIPRRLHHAVKSGFASVEDLAPYLRDALEGVGLAAAPAPAVEREAVAWRVLQIGNTGAAYDLPNTRRAFTYDWQPGNIEASKLGRAADAAANASAGDSIDRGLALLMTLQAEGFGVFQIDAATPPAEAREPVGVDYREAFIAACASLARISVALGIDDDHDDGIEPIMERIAALKAEAQPRDTPRDSGDACQ